MNMTPQYILRKSLCRAPHCAGPFELRDLPLAQWPKKDREAWLRNATSEIESMDYCHAYGEPGYDQPKKMILFANWNYFPSRIGDLLEKAGFSIEWSDEWAINWEGDMKAYRVSPDSYSWRSSIVWLDNGTMLAKGELDKDSSAMDQYIEHLIDRPNHADVFDIDWTEHGFTNMNGTFENGWHPGQTDNPRKILAEYQEKYPDKKFLFQIPYVGQFDINFTIWGRDKEV
jgi:hypothetical protein